MGFEQRNPDVIGHDQSVKPPSVPQHLGQQMMRGVERLAVYVVIGRHDGCRIRALHCHFERQHEIVGKLTLAKVYGRMVAAAFTGGMPNVVLQCCEQPAVFAL